MGFNILLLCAVLTAVVYKDWDRYIKSKDLLLASRIWICDTSDVIVSVEISKTLLSLPDVIQEPYLANKPIEALLPDIDMVYVPYTKEATLMNLHPHWHDDEHMLCLHIRKSMFLCNLFDGCSALLWPFVLPIKIIRLIFYRGR